MTTHTRQRRFALELEQLLISSIIAQSDPVLTGWTTHEDSGRWKVEVYLHSPNRHHGLVVAMQVTVPAFDAALGMDIDTFALIASSGIIESFFCDTPDTDSRMHYRARAGH